MGEDRTEGAQQDESPKEYVTVGEAAKLLGIHRNTVHNRIKAGRITAHKVVEGECEVYPIEWNRSALGAQVQMCVHWALNAQPLVRSSPE